MATQQFKFVDGSFHFFQTFARKPGATLGLMAWHVLAYIALFAGIFLAFGPVVPTIIELSETHNPPTAGDIFAIVGGIWLALVIVYFGTAIVALMVQGAWLRLLTHGRTAAGIPFRFGGDELRLLGVNICFVLLNILAAAIFLTLITLIGFAAGAGGLDNELGALGALGSALFIVIGIVAWLFFAVRLAAAPAMSVNEQDFHLFSSFTATSRFWGWMLLCYVVVYALVSVVGSFIYFFALLFAFVGVADIVNVVQSVPPDANPSEVLGSFLRPVPLIFFGIFLVIMLFLQVFVEAMWHSVGAYAARVIGQNAEPEPEYEVPTASVGDAPGEG